MGSLFYGGSWSAKWAIPLGLTRSASPALDQENAGAVAPTLIYHMNAMGHDVPTMIGVDHRGVAKKISSLIPDYIGGGRARRKLMPKQEVEVAST